MRSFDELNLIEPILTALKDEGYTTPTPIQLEAIPHLLAGSDLLGYAQTGTGKTAAFALPILQHLTNNKKPTTSRVVRALVLAPTRELAAQINDSFHTYGKNLKLSYAAIFGGVGHGRQIQQLSRGVDVLIATPGRLLDLVNQGYVRLNALEFFVLDEADQMFDMGFIHDLKKIVRLLPHNRQTLLFSATMPADISELASKILNKPVTVEVTPVASTAEKIEQKVIFIEQGNKNALLGELLKDPAITRALVFSRTKHGANRIYEKLESLKIRCEAIHGNKSQNARQKALEDFRSGHVRVLVGTDIAARGIDVDGISHVINFDLPNVPESYIHRIGRTARAGTEGVAISFCSKSERSFLRDIERLIKKRLPSEESSVVASESDKPKKSQHADQMKRSFSQKPSSGRNDNGPARSDRGPRAEGGSSFDRPKRSFDRPSGGSSEGRSFAPRSASGGRSDNGPSRFDRAPRAEGASSGSSYDRPKRSFDRPSGGSSEGRPYAPRSASGGRSDNGPSRFDRAPRAEGASSGNNYDRPKRSFDRPSGGSSEGRPYAPRSASGERGNNGPSRFDRAPRAEGGSTGNNYDRPNRSFDRPSGGSSEGRPYAPRQASGGRSDNGPSRFDRAPRAEGGSAGNNYDRPKRSFDRPSGGSSEGRPYAPRSASGGRSDNGPSRFDRAPRAEGGAAGNNSDRPKKPYQKSTKPANRPFSPRPSNGGGSKFSKGNDNSGGAFKDKKAI